MRQKTWGGGFIKPESEIWKFILNPFVEKLNEHFFDFFENEKSLNFKTLYIWF